METALYILLSVICTMLVCAGFARLYIHLNIIGKFTMDDMSENPLCTFELEKLPEEFENKKIVFVRVQKADLSLPGNNKSQQQQVL